MIVDYISMVASAGATIIAAIALFITCRAQKQSLLRERKQATIEAFNTLQSEVLDPLSNVKKSEAQLAAERHLDFDDEREIYNAFRVQIARLEHFAVGISEETYDYETFCRLGGEHVMYLYEKVEPVITEARNCSEKVVPFTEFENLYLKLKEKYSKKTNGEV